MKSCFVMHWFWNSCCDVMMLSPLNTESLSSSMLAFISKYSGQFSFIFGTLSKIKKKLEKLHSLFEKRKLRVSSKENKVLCHFVGVVLVAG